MSPEWQAAAGWPKRTSGAMQFISRHRDECAGVPTMFVRVRIACSQNDLRRAGLRCIEQRLHSMVSRFALWLDSLLRFGALKLFDEVLVKHRAAIVRVR